LVKGYRRFAKDEKGVYMLKKKWFCSIFLLTFAFITFNCEAIEIVGHRGSSFVAPENTKAALMLAWKQGADAAECDVYLTKDKKIMLLHDRSVKRTGVVDVNIADTDSKVLAKIDVGSWKDSKYKNEKIPFLKDIIKIIPKDKKLIIEVKCGTEILPCLEEVIKRSSKRERLEIIAFNFDVASGCKKLMPDIPVYWLIATKKDKKTNEFIHYNIKNIEKVKLAGLNGIDAHYAGVTKEFADEIHANGMKFYVWTVDEPVDAQRMAEMGVDSITTNKPDIMLSYF
jgi:glycerophosphoryl diester phosphodiesterase